MFFWYIYILLVCLPLIVFSQEEEMQEKEEKDDTLFEYMDIFDIQYASQPKISPNGNHIVYRKMGFDIMDDKSRGNLWILDANGKNHRKLTSREVNESQASWSPSGDRIAFSSPTKNGSEIYMYWMGSGTWARMTQLPFSPSSISWSPDGSQIAFSMFVPDKAPKLAKMPTKPKGAKWAEAPRITDRLYHEADGRGYLKPGFNHIFTMPSNGGAVRKLTDGNWHHKGTLSWGKDGSTLYFSANRREDWEHNFRNSEIYSLNVETGEIKELTDSNGPDYNPQISPDGNKLAFLGYEDKTQAYQLDQIRIMDLQSGSVSTISNDFDRDISDIQWGPKGNGLYFNYDDQGNGKVGYITLGGKQSKIIDNRGGTTLGRPYSSGSYSIASNGNIAYTRCSPYHPADIAVWGAKNKSTTRLTKLNQALFNHNRLGKVEEVRYTSSYDNRPLQGWVVYPPDYDPSKKYPFMVENHGGPILNYGDRFSIEMQLYAAHGYVVFYPNARGSTSYGHEFGNLLYNNYPGQDYDDTMDGVDHCIAKGIAHEDQLYVTGGSAGGIMTAWIIGKNNRFEAAVVAKPVMNWISKTLVADNYFYYFGHRYPGQPWENFEGYWKFSPISLVGNIETPTMVMVGMNDLRTPPSEAKQLYHALKLRDKETVLVEIPSASHGIASRPSNLIAKIANTIAWFEKYK